MHVPQPFGCFVIAALCAGGSTNRGQALAPRQVERLQEALNREGAAVVALADAAVREREVPADFALHWHNDFLKAQAGTFVPFVVSVGAPEVTVPAALLYVRAARRPAPGSPAPRARRQVPDYAFEEIYPIDLAPRDVVRVARGFSLAAGEYDVVVVVRERERGDDDRGRRLAAVLRHSLSVPDYETAGLTTSTVILADRMTVLPAPVPAGRAAERPYAIGAREIEPAADAVFARHEELIVVLLVYNPAVTSDKLFDLEVEYHFFRLDGDLSRGRAPGPPGEGPPGPRPGESYVNSTEPQRFTPLALGTGFDPTAGQPVMAGQGVPLAGFPEGDYRLAIVVNDRVSGQSLERHVLFTVRA